jgi:hypothetical protein
MTATRYHWPTPPAEEPTPDAPQVPAPAPAALPAAENLQLRRALKRMTPRLTGRVVWENTAQQCPAPARGASGGWRADHHGVQATVGQGAEVAERERRGSRQEHRLGGKGGFPFHRPPDCGLR